MQLNKYFEKSEIAEVMRSEIRLHPKNPRYITPEARKELKKSVKNFGVLGGIIVNRANGNVIVGGNQKVAILDEINRYKAGDPSTDYALRVEIVDMDEKTELKALVVLNNRRVGGEFDFQKLSEILPELGEEVTDVGLTDEDLTLIGIDLNFRTEGEDSMASDLDDMMSPVNEAHAADVQKRKEERDAIRQAQVQANAMQEAEDNEEEWQKKVDRIKEAKAKTKEQAYERALQNEAYIMLSFENFENKAEFLAQLGYPADIKFVKGEDLVSKVEVIIDDSEE